MARVLVAQRLHRLHRPQCHRAPCRAHTVEPGLRQLEKHGVNLGRVLHGLARGSRALKNRILQLQHHAVLARGHAARGLGVRRRPAVVHEERGLHALRVDDSVPGAGVAGDLEHAHAEAIEGFRVGLAVEAIVHVDVHREGWQRLLGEEEVELGDFLGGEGDAHAGVWQ